MGIGAAVARHAVAVGYRVVLTARNVDKLEALAAELGTDKALALKVDVTEWEQLEGAVEATLARFGRLDAAFANAGFTAGTGKYASGDPTPGEWRDMILTNVLGAALTARATLPEIVKARGHFFLVGSVPGRQPRAVQRHQVGDFGHGRQHSQGGQRAGRSRDHRRAGAGGHRILAKRQARRPVPA